MKADLHAFHMGLLFLLRKVSQIPVIIATELYTEQVEFWCRMDRYNWAILVFPLCQCCLDFFVDKRGKEEERKVGSRRGGGKISPIIMVVRTLFVIAKRVSAVLLLWCKWRNRHWRKYIFFLIMSAYTTGKMCI